jgi:hypothetical protein
MLFPRPSAFFVFALSFSLAPFATAQQAPSNAPQSAAPAANQAPASTPTPAPAAAPAPAPVLPSYSDLLNPSLSGLHDTLVGLRIDKWQRGSVRADAQHDTDSILTDLSGTLPGLLKNADTAPNSLAAALPLTRNFAALYDVSLRVLDASRIAAPADQAAQIQEALNTLAAADRALYDRLDKTAAMQETHIGDLETRLGDLQTKFKAQQVALQHANTPPPACPAPVKKAVTRRRKPAAKPAQPKQQQQPKPQQQSNGSSGA